MAAVQLLQDRDSVVNIDFDHICEFVGDIHEQFDYWERLHIFHTQLIYLKINIIYMHFILFGLFCSIEANLW